ncbi:glycosyltransferase [Thermomonospora umbrina]|uniref:Cellulose synthase/poly-beta-1,6-N-acetylglucosamine synthase-like glycosyltransferase n=1 Tax=Thermomonospora umbrina TaxID=111806 RepID=A0A3D9SQF2_9ACTN|nr:glycosyltransferase [Thermomonospora umbrina]REE94814.1 cellulose synthase/poly-beta-1,6-N-acetylglucosamine synthase-like glycosyltransferase [Thermomonospora umbrina]
MTPTQPEAPTREASEPGPLIRRARSHVRPAPYRGAQVLAVGPPGPRLELVLETLESGGHQVHHAAPGEVRREVRLSRPDAVVALAGEEGGLEVIREVRDVPAGRAAPLVVVTPELGSDGVVAELRNGADDCLPDASVPAELLARVEVKLRRVPVPVEHLPMDPRTGLYSRAHFMDEVDRELQRPEPGPRGGVVAVVGVAEMGALEARLGPRVRREVAERMAAVAERLGRPSDRFGWHDGGRLLMLLPGVDEEAARHALRAFAEAVAGTRFIVADENVLLTPLIGWVPLAVCGDHAEVLERAWVAAGEAARHGDLRPVRYEPWMREDRERRGLPAAFARTLMPVLSPLLMVLVGVGVPLAGYMLADRFGWTVAPVMYWAISGALVLGAVLVMLECLFTLDSVPRPPAPAAPYPAASAVIAAYLPNEAATIVDTVESFLGLDYPGPLDIVLAYNTPHPLPVEETLREIARRDPRLVLLPVPGSTSKAQNLNAAVTRVRGEFVGVFDADHHPHPTSFMLAWNWLSHGYDVVQGHCVVRNGDSSWVARLVAVEFEAIYAVSHPGRARMYGFGLFGGSNGFWRTDLLASTRMHGSMLTEDIDSTMRALESGARIAVDRELISRELAPTTLRALWNQRSRWAQGWMQVSHKYLWSSLTSSTFGRRQKLGLFVLLGWRELQPWFTLQMPAILVYSIWRAGGVGGLDWAVPLFLLATLVTAATGPMQAAFAWRLAAPTVRRRRRWLLWYLLASTLFYGHFKNQVARNAHLKEALGVRQWRVTPRAARGGE